MHNDFLRYEEDFKEWRNVGFPDVSPLTHDHIEHILRPEQKRKLWNHQEDALLKTIYAYELLQIKNSLLNIVTGGGKTAIIGAVISWLKTCHNIQKFLILCPNTIVRDRLESDFDQAKVFRDFEFFPPGCEHYINEMGLHVLGPGGNPQGILENGIVLGNIHQLYQSTSSGKRNLAFFMNYVDEIAIFNDEAHNTPAPEYDSVLSALSGKSKFRLDTTATPDRADGKSPDSRMIIEYTIEDAQAEIPPIIKNIVVYQPEIGAVQLTYTNPDSGEKRTVDEMDEEFEKIEKGLATTQWVTDPDPMRKQIQIAINRLNEQKRRAKTIGEGRYKPILFVVAICIKDAEQACDMLNTDFKLNTLLVTEKSDEADRKSARNLGKNVSPYEAVVSILMLREGWDVPAVGVILLLRKFSSRVYGQQVVGRGLRLNIRDKDIQEICAIVDHKKLNHNWLWDIVGAKIRDDVEQETLFGDEDLPPKRKPQFVANPEMIIEIPEPKEEEDEDFLKDLIDMKIEIGEYPRWREILEGFIYEKIVEISKVDIDAVTAHTLFGDDFVAILSEANHSISQKLSKELTKEEMIDTLKNNIRNISSALLAEEGIGSYELGYFYGVLLDHVKIKLMNNLSIGMATEEDLMHAILHRHTILQNFQKYPGLITSIVKYKEGNVNAKK